MKVGYWSPRTATIDWCEENYEVSHYIAEFWNTISNFIMIVYPIYFLIVSKKWNIDLEFKLCFLSLILVGIGSWAFHMTLLYSMQLLDELPMIWCSCLLLNTVFKMERTSSNLKTALLIAYAFFVTLIYLNFPYPLFHHSSYALLVIYTIYRTGQLLKVEKFSRKFGVSSALIYILGFVLWVIDNKYCKNLKHFRSLGYFTINPLSQMHAWWHILSGLGCYLYLIFLTHISMVHNRKNPQSQVFGFIIPIVKPTSSSLISKARKISR